MTSKKHFGKQTGRPVTHALPTPAGGVPLETFVPWTLVRRGVKKQVITPLDAPQAFLEEAQRERQVREMAQDTPLMRALGLAHHWQRLLDEGRFTSITDIASAEGIDRGQASKIAQLARLAPDIIDDCAAGTFDPQPRTRRVGQAARAMDHRIAAGHAARQQTDSPGMKPISSSQRAHSGMASGAWTAATVIGWWGGTSFRRRQALG
jgi:hypothetical protein